MLAAGAQCRAAVAPRLWLAAKGLQQTQNTAFFRASEPRRAALGRRAASHQATTRAQAASASPPASNVQIEDAFSKLQGVQVYQVSTQQEVDITSLWTSGERAVLAFGRHMG